MSFPRFVLQNFYFQSSFSGVGPVIVETPQMQMYHSQHSQDGTAPTGTPNPPNPPNPGSSALDNTLQPTDQLLEAAPPGEPPVKKKRVKKVSIWKLNQKSFWKIKNLRRYICSNCKNFEDQKWNLMLLRTWITWFKDKLMKVRFEKVHFLRVKHCFNSGAFFILRVTWHNFHKSCIFWSIVVNLVKKTLIKN